MSFSVVKKRLSKANEAYKKHIENVDKLLKLDNLKLPDNKAGGPVKFCHDLQIPQVAEDTINVLKERGLYTEGLFRISGSFDEIQNLKRLYEKGKIPDLSGVDVHVVSGLLKQFLRDLPEPLFTYELYEAFVLASNVEETEKRILYLRKILKRMPTGNRVFSTYLMRFLWMVASRSDKNHMTSKNLAIVFAPSLLRPEKETMDSMLGHSININRVLENMIDHYEDTFLPNTQKKKLSKNNEEYHNMRGTLARATALLWQEEGDKDSPALSAGSSPGPGGGGAEEISALEALDSLEAPSPSGARRPAKLGQARQHRASLMSQKDMTVSANWSNFFKSPDPSRVQLKEES